MPRNDYPTIKQMVRERGLFEPQPRYYSFKILFTLSLLGLSLAFLFLVHDVWLQMLNAAFLAFVDGQLGFLAHDIGHRQVFRGRWKNVIGGLIFGNLLLGMSEEWWITKHNRHHSHPNHLDQDPDIDVPLIAFTDEQALAKRGIPRFIVRYQRYFYLPITALLGFSPRNLSIRFLLRKESSRPWLEVIFLTAHFVLYFGLLFAVLGVGPGLLFAGVHHALSGMYLGSTFAPNHKGMPVLEADNDLDYLHRQVLTARNITAHPFTDFWYGGLNYQIEHHLFPNMPRNRLGEAQVLVKEYCRQLGISYHETSVLQSYREIFAELHRVSAPLRQPARIKQPLRQP